MKVDALRFGHVMGQTTAKKLFQSQDLYFERQAVTACESDLFQCSLCVVSFIRHGYY